MKSFFIILFYSIFVFMPLKAEPLKTVDSVDLGLYTGEWYEIAKYPNWFQRSCAASKAEYTALKDGNIAVFNKCQNKNSLKKIQKAKGRARVVDQKTKAKLKVSFMPLFSQFFEGDYWIIYLDKEYKNAIVGTPKRDYLWILSRSPSVDEETYNYLVSIAEKKGYSPKQIIKTPEWQFGL